MCIDLRYGEVKQNGVWRLVAAAMAERDDAAARRHVETLASSPTASVREVAQRLCASRRSDERRVGVLLVDALLAAAPDAQDAEDLRAARDGAAAR